MKSAISPLFSRPQVLSSGSHQLNIFVNFFLRALIMMIYKGWFRHYDSNFHFKSSMKLHNVLYISKHHHIDNFRSWYPLLIRVRYLDCVLVLILKNCEPETLFVFANIFTIIEKTLFSKLFEGLIFGPCS